MSDGAYIIEQRERPQWTLAGSNAGFHDLDVAEAQAAKWRVEHRNFEFRVTPRVIRSSEVPDAGVE